MDKRRVLVLAALALSAVVVANNLSAMSVALPAIERAFDSELATIQWVINAYLLASGMVYVAAGRLADIYGRRRIFLIGMAIFAGSSLLGGIALTDWWLVAARACQGLSVGLLWPSILGIGYAAVPVAQRAVAGGVIVGSIGLGETIGPILGGVLTEFFSWRWILLLNLPLALLAVLFTLREVEEQRTGAARVRIDYASIATLSLSVVSLMFALDQATDWGWGSPWIIALLVAAVVLFAAFLLVERRAGSSAVVPPDIIRNRDLKLSCTVYVLIAPAFIASLVYLPQFMEKVLGFSPLESGLGLAPALIVFALVSPVASRLYNVLGPKLMVSAGAAGLAAATLLFSLATAQSGYAWLLVGMIVFGVGAGIGRPSLTTTSVSSVDASKSSLAIGVTYMTLYAGGAVGVAIATAIFTPLARDSFVAGLHGAMTFVTILAAAGAVVSVLFIARRPITPGAKEA
jgi:EmrB/QacA subfamily drug resistance transporter